MNASVKHNAGYAIVCLQGEIDLHNSPQARKVILNCLQDGNPTLIDMEQVQYIDSSGIASLVEGFQLARERELDFGLVSISSAVLSVLKLARLDSVFPIYSSVQARLNIS